LQLHEGRDAAASGPADPPVERLAGLVVGQLEDDSEAFLSVDRLSWLDTPPGLLVHPSSR